MDLSHAIIRIPGENFDQGITTAQLGAPDFARMLRQHQAYGQALQRVGLVVECLEPLPDFPDSYFVEDTAVVLPDVAVIARPGILPRCGEEQAMLPVLANYRKIEQIKPPGTIEGGDVLRAGRHFFIGISRRTNHEGAEQLGSILNKHGYTWTPVPVPSGLHLKSSVSWVGDRTLVVTKIFAGREELSGFHQVVLAPEEDYAANMLLINDWLLMPAGFPDTRQKLLHFGFSILELETSEVRKMDGGLSCMSLRF